MYRFPGFSVLLVFLIVACAPIGINEQRQPTPTVGILTALPSAMEIITGVLPANGAVPTPDANNVIVVENEATREAILSPPPRDTPRPYVPPPPPRDWSPRPLSPSLPDQEREFCRRLDSWVNELDQMLLDDEPPESSVVQRRTSVIVSPLNATDAAYMTRQLYPRSVQPLDNVEKMQDYLLVVLAAHTVCYLGGYID